MSPGQAVPTLLDLCTVSPSPTVYTCLSRPILKLDRIALMQASILKWESVSNASQNANSMVPPSSGSPSSGVRQLSGLEHPRFCCRLPLSLWGCFSSCLEHSFLFPAPTLVPRLFPFYLRISAQSSSHSRACPGQLPLQPRLPVAGFCYPAQWPCSFHLQTELRFLHLLTRLQIPETGAVLSSFWILARRQQPSTDRLQ